MPIALLLLVVLHCKARLRRTLRDLLTLRGVMFLTLGGFIIGLGIASDFFEHHSGRAGPDTVRIFFPLWLLTICVLNLMTSAGERAIAFTPAEVDLLFPGPFTRRQLLAYKLMKSAAGALVTATLFAGLSSRHYVQSWVAGGVGIFLSLLFLQLFSMAVVLIGETLGARAYTRTRKMVAGAIIAIGALALLPALRAGRGQSATDLALAFESTSAGRIMLAPFGVFGEIVTARQLGADALSSVGLAVLVLAALVATVMWLDAQYLESAARAGQRAHERIQKIRRGTPIAMRADPRARAARITIPHFPRAGGAGPIAWRQLTTAIRQSRAVVMLLLVMCIVLAPVLHMTGAADHGDSLTLIITIVFSMNILFGNALRFDFRGDLDQLDVLKSLPVRPAAIVVAQLVAPTLVLTVCQVALFVGAGAFGLVDAKFLPAAALIALPVNALLFAVENLLFLLFPAQLKGLTPGDLQGAGRRMIILFAKTMTLLIGCSIAAVAGGTAWVVTGQSQAVFAVTTAAMLTLQTAALLPLIAVAFRRFDPSSDTPP